MTHHSQRISYIICVHFKEVHDLGLLSGSEINAFTNESSRIQSQTSHMYNTQWNVYNSLYFSNRFIVVALKEHDCKCRLNERLDENKHFTIRSYIHDITYKQLHHLFKENILIINCLLLYYPITDSCVACIVAFKM